MKAIIHAINDDNVPGLQHLLGSLANYDVNQPNKVRSRSLLKDREIQHSACYVEGGGHNIKC